MKSYQQKGDANCGPAVVRTVLAFFNRKVLSEKTLVSYLGTRFATGTEPHRIVAFLCSQDLQVEYRQEKNVPALVQRLADGWLPIVCWADWGGHYCVVMKHFRTHIDLLRLADPAGEYEYGNGIHCVSVEHFKSMWYTPTTKRMREVIYVKEDAYDSNGD